MIRYVIRRILATIPVMGVVALFVFLLLHLTPEDPAAMIAGDLATPAEVARIRTQLGLDGSIVTQFVDWLFRILRGDLGVSIFSGTPVSRMIGQRIEPTLSLALSTMIFSVLVAVPIGVWAAWKKGQWIDRAVMALTVASFSLPAFLVGYILVVVLSLRLQLLPVQGFASLGEGIWPFISHLILPTVTLSLVFIAFLARMTRATLIEVLSQEYILVANAKGLGTARILLLHALKNAAIPIVTTIGGGFALVIGGAVVTESVFAIPGLGRLTVDSILHRDYPVIQGITLVFSATYVMLNLAIDLTYTLFDPRIKYQAD
jgi:peptide/nickel transport system permease protein